MKSYQYDLQKCSFHDIAIALVKRAGIEDGEGVVKSFFPKRGRKEDGTYDLNKDLNFSTLNRTVFDLLCKKLSDRTMQEIMYIGLRKMLEENEEKTVQYKVAISYYKNENDTQNKLIKTLIEDIKVKVYDMLPCLEGLLNVKLATEGKEKLIYSSPRNRGYISKYNLDITFIDHSNTYEPHKEFLRCLQNFLNGEYDDVKECARSDIYKHEDIIRIWIK